MCHGGGDKRFPSAPRPAVRPSAERLCSRPRGISCGHYIFFFRIYFSFFSVPFVIRSAARPNALSERRAPSIVVTWRQILSTTIWFLCVRGTRFFCEIFGSVCVRRRSTEKNSSSGKRKIITDDSCIGVGEKKKPNRALDMYNMYPHTYR